MEQGPAGTVEIEIDGFVACLNDAEIARRGIVDDPVTRISTAASHDAGTPERIALGRAAELLRAGANVLAIEIHNSSLGSTDLSLIPAPRTRSGDVVKNGDRWDVGPPSVPLTGATSAAGGWAPYGGSGPGSCPGGPREAPFWSA